MTDSPQPPRQQNVHEAYHGGIDHGELLARGIEPQSLVDLSSNILFVEPPQPVRDAIQSADVSQYPDRNCTLLREALADRHGIDRHDILVGNGCCELIHLVAAAHLKPDDQVLVVGPTFAEYARASELAGATVHEVRAAATNGFAAPLDAIKAKLQSDDYALVWICNPNNPTGQSLPLEVLIAWLDTHPRTLFAIDESYIDFTAATETLIARRRDNLVVLRSMTKFYALAGLRLGYAVASPAVLEPMRARRLPWSVNAVAQAAGVAALKAQKHYDNALQQMRAQRSRLLGELQRQGFSPLETDTGFFLLPVDNAAEFRDRLLDGGVLVRDCSSFGIAAHVRIAVGDEAATERLLKVVKVVARSANLSEDTARSEKPHDVRGANNDLGTVRGANNDLARWDDAFREQLFELFRMRRDVRRFRTDPLPADSMARWIEAAGLAPSVGLSQPWRFASVRAPEVRERVVADFETENERAAAKYDDDTASHYRQLKLAGLREAPEHLAVFVEPDPQQGKGLGRQTMPETVAYSVVAAIQNFWLAARADGVGVGWVSILRPEHINQLLDVSPDWQLIAYLCVGYPLDESQDTPELERRGWQHRSPTEDQWKR